MMLDFNYEVKLVDFGQSKSLFREKLITDSDKVLSQ